jgi:hypothetical protein
MAGGGAGSYPSLGVDTSMPGAGYAPTANPYSLGVDYGQPVAASPYSLGADMNGGSGFNGLSGLQALGSASGGLASLMAGTKAGAPSVLSPGRFGAQVPGSSGVNAAAAPNQQGRLGSLPQVQAPQTLIDFLTAISQGKQGRMF